MHEFAVHQTQPVNCYDSVIRSAENQKLDSIFQQSGYQSEQPGLAVVCLGVIHADWYYLPCLRHTSTELPGLERQNYLWKRCCQCVDIATVFGCPVYVCQSQVIRLAITNCDVATTHVDDVMAVIIG